MLGLINAVTATFGAIDRYVKQGLVMANRFLTPPKLSHPAQGSAEFDGSSDYIQLDTPFSHTNHTIAAWVYSNDVADWRTIFSANDTSANDGIRLTITNTDQIRYTLNTASGVVDLPQDEWVYVVCSYDGSDRKIYLNGSESSSVAVSQTISVTTNAKIGGLSYNTSETFDGNLANVAIWNRALSSDEINAVMWKGYQSLTDNEKSGLKAWYSLDDVASPAASLATMEALAVDKDATIENKAAVTAAINALS